MNRVLSVTDLNRYVGEVLSQDPILSAVSVKGEISGLKKYPSGHVYFSLKDRESQVSCVAFRGNATRFSFTPADGMAVVISARASLYDRDGRFQLVVYDMKKDGIGDLFAEFEARKERLRREGLFDEDRKKPLPILPQRIGVVTSPKGAVIRDIIQILSRRYPNFNLLIYPSAVQGKDAGNELSAGIAWFNASNSVDVIIIARGGGSVEDLFCFNDESLVRQIAASRIPVISAVGHETDFTLCDFVSDLRAPTPSAAAELVLPEKDALKSSLHFTNDQLRRALLRKSEAERRRLKILTESSAMQKPLLNVERGGQRLDMTLLKLQQGMKQKKDSLAHRLVGSMSALDALSPLKVLTRGYTIATEKEENKTIPSASGLSPGDRFRLRFWDGTVICETIEKESGGTYGIE